MRGTGGGRQKSARSIGPQPLLHFGIASKGEAGGSPSWTTAGWVHAAAFAALIAALAWIEGARPNDDLAARRALAAISPQAEEAHLHLAESLRSRGSYGEAIGAYRESLRLKPASIEAQLNLGVTLATVGRIDQAIEAYERVLAIDSGYAVARFNLAGLLAMRGRTGEALRHYEAVLEGGDAQTRELARKAIGSLKSGN